MFQLLELRRGAGSLFCERKEEVGAAVEGLFSGVLFLPFVSLLGRSHIRPRFGHIKNYLHSPMPA